jgi:hypothetical protein
MMTFEVNVCKYTKEDVFLFVLERRVFVYFSC